MLSRITVACFLCAALSPGAFAKDDRVPVDPNGKFRKVDIRFMPGGSTAVDLTNGQNLANVRRLANAAVQRMNSNWYGSYSWGLANVISATSQVQSGVNYVVKFTIGQTVCQNQRANPPNPNTCSINNSASGSYCQCEASILERSWLNPSLSIGYWCQKVNYLNG